MAPPLVVALLAGYASVPTMALDVSVAVGVPVTLRDGGPSLASVRVAVTSTVLDLRARAGLLVRPPLCCDLGYRGIQRVSARVPTGGWPSDRLMPVNWGSDGQLGQSLDYLHGLHTYCRHALHQV